MASVALSALECRYDNLIYIAGSRETACSTPEICAMP
jgi:hypothetical protein